ncbi:MAG: 3-methyl-2-oxobutanoate hydroxymethyltransferase [Fibromonadaceae bacterium]|jgi:3-methyl-2-oxobutanoate hydroxymethyltransferase|nr:3-methyl-2-oxobutanoate hydroxymethyltransferase [Fibromonadaceae bacterium]
MLGKNDFYSMKKNGEAISMVTVYDSAFARMAEAAKIDMLLVGDSAANTMLGMDRTAGISMEAMCLFTSAVKRGAPNSYIVSDMPYGSDTEPELALQNATKLLEAGAHAVKIEGLPLKSLEALREKKIEIVGHLGLLPQTAKNFKQVGKNEEEAEKIIEQAKILDSLEPCAVVLEHIPDMLGEKVSRAINAPTIGIGAGQQTDGQVLVMHDILLMHPFKLPPFAKNFANFWEAGVNAFCDYKNWVCKKKLF